MDIPNFCIALVVVGVIVVLAVRFMSFLTDVVDWLAKVTTFLTKLISLSKTQTQNFNIIVDIIAAAFGIALILAVDEVQQYFLITVGTVFLIIFSCLIYVHFSRRRRE